MGGATLFTYRQALETFPAVRERTEAAVAEVEALRGRPGGVGEDLEEEIRDVVRRWADDITALGCEVKGLWLVDWDSGDGYFCWRWPEESLGYFHSYEAGFAGRMPIA